MEKKLMAEAIRDFPSQFTWNPEITGGAIDHKHISAYIVLGMGGSHLAADLLSITHPNIPLFVWSDYGLPQIPKEFAGKTLVIGSSYSGNTEEVVDGLKKAAELKMPAVAVASEGTILGIAYENKFPSILLPPGLEPRAALGFSFRALLKIIGDEQALKETEKLAQTLSAENAETEGKTLALDLSYAVPVIYASRKNAALAYNWKIKFNETAKIPAFYNVFPELNHNEMSGFDSAESTKRLAENFYFLILTDEGDHPQIQKRTAVLRKIYAEKGLRIKNVVISGNNVYEKIFRCLMVADFAALTLAENYGTDPGNVPLIEKFKREIRGEDDII